MGGRRTKSKPKLLIISQDGQPNCPIKTTPLVHHLSACNTLSQILSHYTNNFSVTNLALNALVMCTLMHSLGT